MKRISRQIGSIFVCLFLQTSVTTLTPTADAIVFGSSYSPGTLHDQPSGAALSWKVVNASGYNGIAFNVDPSAQLIKLDVTQTASENLAIWRPLINPSQGKARFYVDFTFGTLAGNGSGDLLRLQFRANPDATGEAISATLRRITSYGNTKIQIKMSNSVGGEEMRDINRVNFGLSDTDLDSDLLRAELEIVKGPASPGWGVRLSLYNLTTGAQIGLVSLPNYSSSAAFYSDTSLYAAISTANIQTASMAYLRMYEVGTPQLSAISRYQHLAWSDEFSYTGLPDPAKWGYEKGGGIRNDEWQYYTKERLENARVEGGNLVIEARKELYTFTKFGELKTANYTSASLITKTTHPFTYGRVDIRAKIPSGTGLWPALWALGTSTTLGANGKNWPLCGEIDLLENVGYDTTHDYFTFHNEAYNGDLGRKSFIPDPYSGFHLYSLEWTPTRLILLMDNMEVQRYDKTVDTQASWPFDLPFYMIMNVAIGGNWGAQQGVPDATFATPRLMLVDYIRIYDQSLPARLEGESLETFDTSGDAKRFESDAACSNGITVVFDFNRAADYAKFEVAVGIPGTYRIKVGAKRNSNRGSSQLFIDGSAVPQGNAMDQYAATADQREFDLGTVSLEAGTHEFVFRNVGKNSASSDYTASLDYLVVTP